MKNFILGIVSIACIASCTSNNEKQENTADSLAVDSSATPADTAGLNGFGTELVDQKKACKAAFDKITSDDDFLAAYHLLCKLETDMNAKFDKVQANDNYEEFDKQTSRMMGNALPWIQSTLCAEGTVPISEINNTEILKTAKQSSTPNDDLFANFLLAMYGETGSKQYGLPAWTTMDCDDCYAGILGNGKTFEALAIADKLKTQAPVYSSDVDSIISPFFTQKENIYDTQQSEIIDEIDKILANIKLTDAQRSILQNRRADVADTAKSHIKVNCAQGDCRYY